MSYARRHLDEAKRIIDELDADAIERAAEILAAVRARGGRLFFLGVGGSAANCSHAVNDFRKIAGFEAYAPTDNVSELTARVNDEGLDTSFSEWLKGSRLGRADAVLVFSVGGGSREQRLFGIVGKDGGHTAGVADACVVIPTVSPIASRRTPGACAPWAGTSGSPTPR
jgi:D-sedoheptulose 7-phosphate isomerase